MVFEGFLGLLVCVLFVYGCVFFYYFIFYGGVVLCGVF